MKYLPYLKIEDAANEFLAKHHAEGTVPIPVDYILEFELGLDVVTHRDLFQKESIDAFLSSDFTELHIDEDHYLGQTNRSRFTIAHEIGHFVLHKEIVSKCKTIEDWKALILGAGKERDIYEYQANDFAGCLLMPRGLVLTEFERHKQIAAEKFKELGLDLPGDPLLAGYVANDIAKIFDVSAEASEIRLGKILKFQR